MTKCDKCGAVIPEDDTPWEFKGKFYCEKCADEMVEYLERDEDATSNSNGESNDRG